MDGSNRIQNEKSEILDLRFPRVFLIWKNKGPKLCIIYLVLFKKGMGEVSLICPYPFISEHMHDTKNVELFLLFITVLLLAT